MLNRLMGIIYILMNKGTVTAGELAERYEVSVRTIYRDVEHLSMAGIPIYAKKGKNGGISLTERFVLDKMLISDEEQQQILAALASLREIGIQEESEILKKLGDFFKTEAPDWVVIDFSDWSGRRKELFEQLKNAILGKHVLTFDYYGQYGEMSRRTVEPVQLLFKEYTWYLRAYCRKRQAMRLFKVLRMKRVEVLEETFDTKLDYHAKEKAVLYSLEGKQGAPQENAETTKGNAEVLQENAETQQENVEVPQKNSAAPQESTEITFLLDKKEAYRVYDRFDEEEITVLPDGDFRIKICCPLDDWTYGLILSFGPSAQVLEPAYVREELARRIQEMQKNYL